MTVTVNSVLGFASSLPCGYISRFVLMKPYFPQSLVFIVAIHYAKSESNLYDDVGVVLIQYSCLSI